MANQIDNLTLNDDTTGLIRTVDVAADDLFLSVDLTLQSGGVLTADNIKRGTVDPNAGAGTAGNEGDVYQRTLGATGELYVNTDGTNTGWAKLLTAAGATPTWAQVLAAGNVSGGTDAEISNGDSIVGEDNAAGDGHDLPLTAGNSTGGGGDGGDVVISPGTGNGAGVDGVVIVNGTKHYADSATDPTSPAPAEGDRYYNTSLEMEMRYDGLRSKWLSVECGTLDASDNGNVPVGTYFRVGWLRMAGALGFTAHFDGTIVSLGYTRSDVDSADFAVTANGVTIATVNSVATSGYDTTLNANFSQGAILGLRNDGPNAMANVIAWIRMKWRVT
jgi:hypothetical protein